MPVWMVNRGIDFTAEHGLVEPLEKLKAALGIPPTKTEARSRSETSQKNLEPAPGLPRASSRRAGPRSSSSGKMDTVVPNPSSAAPSLGSPCLRS
jgi:hypothetical protein